ncbi:hypothetical protein BS50DRAFT_123100 [Corynespora cassiicola Philippines]|uniref:Uncharacterized protein n=1 Tax=Corynespora cassiicola Philippines TaxID=1448308 RepID=A0A2T2NB22_CORCC|nr:hypothetical protein BS50DRAFT_123100 [Corynespora cassiicola Philippines]
MHSSENQNRRFESVDKKQTKHRNMYHPGDLPPAPSKYPSLLPLPPPKVFVPGFRPPPLANRRANKVDDVNQDPWRKSYTAHTYTRRASTKEAPLPKCPALSFLPGAVGYVPTDRIGGSDGGERRGKKWGNAWRGFVGVSNGVGRWGFLDVTSWEWFFSFLLYSMVGVCC